MALIDMAMPILNGMQTMQELKKQYPECIYIMITAYRDAEKVVEAFSLGACDCIFKPFDLNTVRQAIKNKLPK
jgi:DNA-binding NtrC family response regulator